MYRYQEEETSTFGHEGKQYRLNILLRAVHRRRIHDIAIEKLIWIFDHCKPDPERVAVANLQFPILVHFDKGRWVVVDGLHRLARAHAEQRLLMQTKVVFPLDLTRALIKD